ncbi:MAG: hypothetical protein AB1744_14445, partial [Candidatus Zixiibacteriota bacterium]
MEYEVIVDLRDPSHLGFAERLLGNLSDSSLYLNRKGIYLIKMSLENALRLGEEGIELDTLRSQRDALRDESPGNYVSRSLLKVGEIDVDTLSLEELTRKYRVILWLRDSIEENLVEDIVGDLPDSTRISDRHCLYRLWISLQDLLKISERNIDGHFVTPPPWRRQERVPNDSVSPLHPGDSTSPQGRLDLLNQVTDPDGLSLAYIDGLTPGGELERNRLITFYLRVHNYHWFTVDGITNGFRIYTPDGAEWSSVSGDTLPVGWGDIFTEYFEIWTYSADGRGVDTVGFFGIAGWPNGLSAGYNQVVLTITIGPISDAYAGKTICLDSSFFGFGGYWLWSYGGGQYIWYPPWDGPHCFTIEPNTITFSGHLFYLDPVPPDTDEVPMRHVRVEMWDADVAFDDSLDADITDDNGYFYL